MKKNYKYPKKEDLKKGNILPIYLDYKQEEKYEGEAVLLEKTTQRIQELPYIRIEIGGTNRQEPHTINWSFQRWLVQFINGPLEGFVTHRYIGYYISTKSNINSGYRRDKFENMTEKEFEEFIEEQEKGFTEIELEFIRKYQNFKDE